jgi:hypothetical protein
MKGGRQQNGLRRGAHHGRLQSWSEDAYSTFVLDDNAE